MSPRRRSLVCVLAVLAAGCLSAAVQAAPVRTLICHRTSSTSCKITLAVHPAENGLTIRIPLPRPDKGYSPTLNKQVPGFGVDPTVNPPYRVYIFVLGVPRHVPKGAILTISFTY
jgi:hypothetical protein